MTRDEKMAEARRLRDEGYSLRAIGRALGHTHTCVLKWLNPDKARERARQESARPERKAAKRAWEREHYRGECPCGAQTARPHIALCRGCHDEVVAVERAMREERIAEMWSRGLTLPEVAAAMGTTAGSINVSLTRMRERGWDVPRRRNWSPEGLERAQNARRAA